MAVTPGRRSRRPEQGRTEAGRVRRFRTPVLLFVVSFLLASAAATLAYDTTSGNGTGQAQAVTLSTPGTGSTSNPTTASLLLSWGASPGLPASAGYLVLQSTAPTGPYTKLSSGGCAQATTLVSTATTCTDSGLSAGTTYYYEVEAGYYDVDTLWTSAPDAQFSGTTGPTAPSPGAGAPTTGTGQQPTGNPGTSGQAPTITSASSILFLLGTADDFQVTASGSPAPTFSNAAFNGCTPTALPPGVTLSNAGLLSGTPGSGAAGTYTLCINAVNGLSPDATQSLTLTIGTGSLVISSPAVSGAASSTPNLGPITVRRQTSSGIPLTTDAAVTVTLTSTTSVGASFGTAQFAPAPVSTITIPSGQSTATFWYGSTTAGSATISASAVGYVSGTQQETITTAPAGLGILPGTGSTGTPVISCGSPAATFACKVTGVGSAGRVVFSVVFWDSAQDPVVYSGTQASTISESGQGAGAVTIQAGAAGSGPATLSASVGTSTLTFGPYSLTVDVGP